MNQHHQAQWDNVIPRKIVDSEDGPDGGAVLLVPRFRKGPLAKWLQPRLRKPFIRVKLDDLGSFVWKRIDGNCDYSKLLVEMTGEFGEKLEHADERLQKFLTLLQNNDFADLVVLAEEATEPTA